MESLIIRSAVVYLFIFLILRLAGKRTLSEMTTFDLILVLIISEATQQALIDDDHSITGAALVITTLVFIDILVSLITSKSKTMDKLINGIAVIIVEDGKPLRDRMKKSRVQMDDVLEAARRTHGLESLDEIKYAIIEKDGSISIIPRQKDALQS